ncbi:MAG: hypothetical protein KAI17_27700, partial [Thiotrichaceae bacterium]|nr:hypothetical protein [Thiotrichaceae bacterium]
MEQTAQSFCRKIKIFTLFVMLSVSTTVAATIIPELYIPLPGLSNKNLAVIINDADPLSMRIGDYYQKKRDIPVSQMIHISFTPGLKTLSSEQFKLLKKQVDKQTPNHVQAYV